MLERQYLTRRGGLRVVYPECQTAQYILPCFIASFISLYEDTSVPEEKKKEFLLFVHNLVESYETQEFCQELDSACTIKKHPFLLFSQNEFILLIKINYFKCYIGKHLKTFLAGSQVYNNLCDEKSQSIFHCPERLEIFPLTWTSHIFLLYCRMNTCLKNNDLARICILVQFLIHRKCLKESSSDLLFEVCRQNLSFHQLFGIITFCFFRSFDKDKAKEKLMAYQGPGFPLDDMDSAMWALFSGDMWTVKQKVSSMVHHSGQDDQTLASLELAKSNIYYEEALKTGLNEDRKVKMSSPGEITFFPVKHCRWCGLVEADTFRKCPVCVDNPDFPDVNYFCSEKCETEALDKQHTEEHVTFLLIRCGIN